MLNTAMTSKSSTICMIIYLNIPVNFKVIKYIYLIKSPSILGILKINRDRNSALSKVFFEILLRSSIFYSGFALFVFTDLPLLTDNFKI